MVMAVGVSEKGGPPGMSRPPFLFSYENVNVGAAVPLRYYGPAALAVLGRGSNALDGGDGGPFRCHRPALLNSVSASDLWAAQKKSTARSPACRRSPLPLRSGTEAALGTAKPNHGRSCNKLRISSTLA